MKLTIGKKLVIGFGIILLAVLVNAVIILNSSIKNSNLNTQIIENYSPSETNVNYPVPRAQGVLSIKQL